MTELSAHIGDDPRPNCFGVKVPQIGFYFSDAWALLEPAAARNGLYTRESVYRALMAGLFQLWVCETEVMQCAAITEVSDYPAGRSCFVVLMGGRELDRALPFLETMERWAKACGCQRMVCSGRRGLAKKLKGYREGSVILTKDFFDA